MRFRRVAVCILTALMVLGAIAWAQADGQTSSLAASTVTVPRLIRLTGSVKDEAGQRLTGGPMGITFTLYKDEAGQAAVWQESQTVQLDANGRYNVLLGASNEAGLPLEIFSAGEARWLGVRPDGQAEQPRILFLSVAYALKAADTDMLGGRPASAYALADQSAAAQAAAQAFPANGPQVIVPASSALPLLVSPQAACSAVTSGGRQQLTNSPSSPPPATLRFQPYLTLAATSGSAPPLRAACWTLPERQLPRAY